MGQTNKKLFNKQIHRFWLTESLSQWQKADWKDDQEIAKNFCQTLLNISKCLPKVFDNILEEMVPSMLSANVFKFILKI